jgi:replicative DNA helicase
MSKTTRKKASVDVENMMYGKTPPQNIPAEEQILGTILNLNAGLDIVAEILRPEDFYMDAHQRIFRAMLELDKKGQPVDIVSVYTRLKEKEESELVGAPYALTQLSTKATGAGGSLEHHARKVKETAVGRDLIRACGQTIASAFDGDPFDAMKAHEQELTEISLGINQRTLQHAGAKVVDVLNGIATLRKNDKYLTGVPTGYRDMDTLTHGWQAPDLIILAARPSVGKTALALNLAWNAASNTEISTDVLLFSLEMSTDQLIKRLLSHVSGVKLDRLLSGKLEEDEWKAIQQAANKINAANLYIDDTASMDVYSFTRKVKAAKRKSKTKKFLVIADYLQLFSGPVGQKLTREQIISEVSRQMKIAAKEAGVPIIALSQLSRETEKRTGDNKKPKLSDLRDSGAIEQDADVVMLMYRYDYYDKTGAVMSDRMYGETEINFAKNRNGSVEEVKLIARLETQSFNSYDPPPKEKSEPQKRKGFQKIVVAGEPDLFEKPITA